MTFTADMNTELAKPLDPANVKPPAPGKRGEYVEAWHAIAEANRIFGFDGWSRETVEIVETCRELLTLTGNNGEYKQWRVGFRAKVRIVAHGVVREGTGAGSGQAKPELLYDAIESAAKEAESDAMKRALMTFGNPFGLALYDKTKANVQAPPPPAPTFISDDQRDQLSALATAAGMTLQFICESYHIASLKELPASKFSALQKRLQSAASDQPQQKAAA